MIRVLNKSVIDKIAAGEVVERPKSIVKELVENSIDAGATRITVEIRDGGKDYIRVTDNGSGIDKDDIRLAVARHATSKIVTAEELIGIKTLGFRGEALSTISAVTETEIVTKTPDSMTGIKYIVHGGNELMLSEIGAPDGTTIICKNLFYNVPARRKFLKTGMTEASYITDIMTRFALSCPDISFKLINNDRTVIDTSGNGKLKDVIYALYGKDITRSLLEVNYSEGDISIVGFTGKPYICKGNRSFETYFVNGRYIGSKIVVRAIEEAYKTYIMQHKFPFTVLNITLPGEKCDVNIHPSKQEFKYENEKELFSAVYHAVADSLKEKVLIPNYGGQYEPKSPLANGVKTSHVTVANETGSNEINENRSSSNESAANINTENKNGSIYSTNSIIKNASFVKETIKKTDMDSFSVLDKMLPPEFREELRALKADNEKISGDVQKVNESTDDVQIKNESTDDVQIINKSNDDVRNVNELTVDKFKYEQQSLTDDKYLSKEALPKHKIIGLVFNTYWITEYMNDLYLMDQHAAHEKINYERFMAEFKERKVVSQNLFPPEVISLSPIEKQAVLDNLEYFEKTGFEISDFGDKEIRLSAIPVNLVGMEGRDIFLEFVSYLSSDVNGVTEDIFVHKIATMGCKAAVKGNQHISVVEVQALIDELMTLENPYTCPHGRPTIIKISKEELDKKFKRIV